MSRERLSGGCLCGAVRFEVGGAPYRVGVCHCLDCRKAHGAAFRFFAIYPADQVKWTGETANYVHEGKDRRHFCPRCGGPVLAEDGSDEIEVFLGALDEPDQMRPTYELWMGRRESWLPELPVAHRYAHDRQGPGRGEPE
jgi:hypothetical protein